MKRKLVLLGLVLALVALPLAACAKPAPAPTPAPAPVPAPAPAPSPAPTPAPSPPSQEVIHLTFATIPGTSMEMLGFIPPHYRFNKMVEKATNGRLIIESKIDLIPDHEVPVAVAEGRVDIGRFYSPWTSGTWPQWDYGSLPFSFPDIYAYEEALEDPRLVAIIEKMYAEAGLVQLMDAGTEGSTIIWSNVELRKIADFEGLKCRATGLLMSYALDLMGANSLTMPYLEVAEAISRGTIDATISDRAWAFSVGMSDVTEYSCYWPIGPIFGNVTVINKDTFDALPADVQQILKDVSREFQRQIVYSNEVGWNVVNNSMELVGQKLVMPDPGEIEKAKELTKSVYDDWLEIAGPYGPEILAIIRDYF